MAQSVGFFEENLVYTEGPFVICNPFQNGWRIEVDEGGSCPVLPHSSIYQLLEQRFKFVGKTHNKPIIAKICDELNLMVKRGQIIQQGKSWMVATL